MARTSMEQDCNVHLKWNRHQDTLTTVFTTLLESEKLVDCMLSAEGQCLSVHKIVLSACSPYFDMLFSRHYERHPIIVIPDVKFQVLKSIIYFMYCGEVSILQDDLDTLLRLADFLQIKGLSKTVDVNSGSKLVSERQNDTDQATHSVPIQLILPSALSSSSHREIQRDRVTKVLEDKQPRHQFQKKHCREAVGVSTAHKHRESDQCSVSSYRTNLEPSTSKEGNSSEPAKLGNLPGFTIVKTVSLDTASEICPSTFSGCNYTESLVKETRNDPEVLKSESPTPLSTMTTLDADEDMYGLGAPTGVSLEPKCEDFEDNMEIIELDDQNESGSDVSEAEKKTSKQPFLDGESSIHELQFGQAKDSSEYVQGPTPVGYSQSAHSNPCECPRCGRTYLHYSSFVRHAKFECGKEPQFKCPQCPSRYTQKSHLKTHMRKHH